MHESIVVGNSEYWTFYTKKNEEMNENESQLNNTINETEIEKKNDEELIFNLVETYFQSI